MSVEINYPHLTMAADQPVRIGKSRYQVLHLAAEHYQHGWTAEELMRQHPDLRPEEVYAALTYFYDHREELIAELKATFKKAESSRTAQPLSRDELLARQSNAGS
jgi:uncharacterized protein (DUF433 family)